MVGMEQKTQEKYRPNLLRNNSPPAKKVKSSDKSFVHENRFQCLSDSDAKDENSLNLEQLEKIKKQAGAELCQAQY